MVWTRSAMWLGGILLGIAAAMPAQAKIYCCNDDSGRRVCGDPMPPACQAKAHKEIGRGGASRDVAAPPTAEQRAAQEAEAARKKEEENRLAEEKRRDKALLNTYSSEKDIDILRDRTMAGAQNGVKEAQGKYDELMKRKKKLEGEAEFYKNKPLPAPLKAQVAENETALKKQQSDIEARQKEIEAVRAKFEDDKRRYLELTGKK